MIENEFKLSGKVAMVTGASRGLGRAIAKGLASAGADLVVNARSRDDLENLKKEIRTLGRSATVADFDLNRVEEIAAFYDNILQQVEKVDILVNVAGVNLRKAAVEWTLEEWESILRLNLTVPFVLDQCFARACIADNRGGKIIHIASLLSEAARASIPAYTASKGGIKMLTRALAVEWARYQIQVNAIGPGYFKTELTKPLWQDDSFSQWVLESTPANRWGEPDDLVATALFLASRASDYITGQTIYVDGGWLANL